MVDKKQIENMYSIIKKSEEELLENFDSMEKKRDLILKISNKNSLMYNQYKKSKNFKLFSEDLKIINDRTITLSKKFLENNDDVIKLHKSISNSVFEILSTNNIDENIIEEKMKLFNNRILEHEKMQMDLKNILKNIGIKNYE